MSVWLCLLHPLHAAEPIWQHFEEAHMATRIELLLPQDESTATQATAVFRIFAQVEEEANEWREGSPLATVNARAGGEVVPVPPGLLALAKVGLQIGVESEGAFDITWAALWGLWDFRQPKLPAPEEINARLPLIDYGRVEVGEGTLRLPQEGMKIGLGGIAKGWALDRAQLWLRSQGRRDFLLSAGGQVYAAGYRSTGQPWRVGVRDPRGGPEAWFAMLPVTDASVSTSGDYERYFEVEGQRYHHILDPDTGYPSRGLQAATVVTAEATWADGLSTAVMVMGARRGLALLERLGASGLVVTEEGQVQTTPGLQLWGQRPPIR